MSTKATILTVIAVYAVCMMAIGILNSRNTKNINDFTIGKRNAGGWISALSYGTSYFSAVMFVGYAGSAGWSYGLWATLVGIGNAIIGSFLAWFVLAKRTREVTTRLKTASMPQFFDARYNSRAMKLFSCIVIFIFLLPYSASVYNGLASICSVLLGIDELICMIIIAVAAAVILFLSGYMGMLKADFFQGIIMFVGVIALVVMFMFSDPVGGFGDGISKMTEFMKNNEMAPLSPKAALSLVSMILMTSFGTWGLPQMIHKYYAIKDEKEVKRGMVVSRVFAIVVGGGGYFVGSFSHLFFDENLGDKIIPSMLRDAGLPNILLGIILVLLISASVSTLTSITLTACSTLSMDLIKDRFNKSIDAIKLGLFTKILCVVFVLASFVIATTKTPILDMMSYSWGILAGSFLAPYALALYFKKLNKIGAWAGMLGGFVCALPPLFAKLFAPTLEAPFGLGLLAAQGTVFACIAIIVSVVLCISVSLIAGALNVKGSEPNEKFYAKDN